MSGQQLIPYERIQDYFRDQCGISISTGSLFNFNKEAYGLLESFETITRSRLIGADVVNADETGININGKRLWLHSASNDLWTMFFPHQKRGHEAMMAMGVLEHFAGTLCHDHWKPYFQFDCDHSLCNAHHLRELERAFEQDNQKWAKRMMDLLCEINEAVEKAGGKLNKTAAAKYRKRYRTILTQGENECPIPNAKGKKPKRGRTKKTKARNLLERLREYETETLRFMTDKNVPFTNNQGENDLRMTKVQQKISGCFRSMDGAKIFCRVRGYLTTSRKHGVKPTQALQILFAGNLPKSAFQKE
jgi:transposase